jgi:hypothetical protein
VPPRSMARSSADDHWEVLSSYKDDVSRNPQPKQQYRERDQIHSPRPPALLDSRSSSLASLPPGASPPIQSPNAPRSGSPHNNNATPTQSRGTLPRDRDRDADRLRRKQQPPAPPVPSPAPTSTAALGILRALDPFASLDDRENKSHHGHHSDEALLGEEKKEKRPFWGKDREKERERDRGGGRRDEENPAELTRMIGACDELPGLIGQWVDIGYGHIGYLTATASEDWSLVLEVCDRASASEANAKEAVKALRREFKYVVLVYVCVHIPISVVDMRNHQLNYQQHE